MKKLNTNKLLFVIIIITAAFLRLSNLWYMEFKGDEATNSFLTVDFICKGNFPLVGDMSSQGPYNPPMFIYLLGVPFLFSKNPVVASGYIALLNFFAVFLCFQFCKEFFNRRIALISTAFFAVNPWVILYSRKIWANNLLSLFVLLFIYSICKVIIKRQNKYILLSFASLAIFTQLHFSAICYIILLFIVLATFRPNIKPLYYGAGLGIFLFLYLPYILFDIKYNFYNLGAFIQFSKLPFKIQLDAFIMPFSLATTYGFEDSLGLSFNEFISRIFYSPIPSIVVILSLCAAIVYLIRRMHMDKKYFVLTLWFFIPIAFICFNKYCSRSPFISLFPVQFIVLAVFYDALKNKFSNRRLLSIFMSFILFCLITYQFMFSFGFYQFIKTKRCIYGDYGPPFKYRVEEIKEAMKEGNRNAKYIHRKISQDKKCFKYDFYTTKYIVENIGDISS